MVASKVRTVIASEYPEARHLLTEVTRGEPGVVVVGQAENAVKAMALARSLRPDVVMVDSRLPHIVGLDEVRLSRISGLDAAMDISQELPRTRVVVLASFKVAVYQARDLDDAADVYLYAQSLAASYPIRLRQLYHEAAPASNLVFANVEVKERAPLRHRLTAISDKAMLYSGLALLGGLGLMLTLILAAPGAVLALAGGAGLLLSLAGRAAAAWWPRSRREAREPEPEETGKLEAA